LIQIYVPERKYIFICLAGKCFKNKMEHFGGGFLMQAMLEVSCGVYELPVGLGKFC
jgi:hypothetical protein